MKLKLIFEKSLPFLLFILFFGFFIYKVNQVPVSLFSDEADANYQAFIFNQKKTDYFGNKFPIHFHSYSDWRTSLYIYSVALTQKIVGHTDIAVRIPAAFFGALSVVIFFLISKKICQNSSLWGLIGGLLYGFTPWLYFYSRSGFEVTQMITFLLLGIYFWIKFLDQKKYSYLFLSAGSFLATIYSYSTAKLFIFFLAFVLLSIWFKTLINLPLKIKISIIIFSVIFCLPFLSDFIKGRAGYRFSYINIFSDPTVSKTVDILRQEDSVMIHGQEIGLSPTLSSKIFYNKFTQWSQVFIKNYFSSFSTNFLFLTGDGNLRQGIQTAGNLLLPSFFLIIIGISTVFKRNKNSSQKISLFFLICLILTPIPFSLTRDSVFPHATRLILMLPFLMFFSLLGLKQIFEITKSKILVIFIFLLYIPCLTTFLHQYFYHYPNISAREWHYGMKQAVLKSTNTNYSKVYFINSYEPFLPFFLNYTEYLPINSDTSPAESIVWDNNSFFTGMTAQDKYYFGNIEWSDMFNHLPNNTIFVVPQKELSRIEQSLKDYNQSHPTKINQSVIDKIDQQFTEQEKFYLITFKL